MSSSERMLSRQAWNRFWFRPVPATELAMGRIALLGLALWEQGPMAARASLARWADIGEIHWKPISVFAWIPMLPTQSSAFLVSVSYAWLGAMAMGCAGWLTRVSLPLAFVSGFFLFGYPNCFGKTHHPYHMLVVALGILAFSRCGDFLSLDWLRKGRAAPAPSPEYRWPVQLIRASMMLFYFEAGFQKLRHSGISWASSENMVNLLVGVGKPEGVYFATHFPWLCGLLAKITLFSQLFGWLSLFSPRWAMILVPSLFGFHLGSRFLLGDFGYFTPVMICFVFWVPWERLISSVGSPHQPAGTPMGVDFPRGP